MIPFWVSGSSQPERVDEMAPTAIAKLRFYNCMPRVLHIISPTAITSSTVPTINGMRSFLGCEKKNKNLGPSLHKMIHTLISKFLNTRYGRVPYLKKEAQKKGFMSHFKKYICGAHYSKKQIPKYMKIHIVIAM